MAAVLGNALVALAGWVCMHLPGLGDPSRSMSSDTLRDGSRYW
jgi:hypothetical protein